MTIDSFYCEKYPWFATEDWQQTGALSLGITWQNHS